MALRTDNGGDAQLHSSHRAIAIQPLIWCDQASRTLQQVCGRTVDIACKDDVVRANIAGVHLIGRHGKMDDATGNFSPS